MPTYMTTNAYPIVMGFPTGGALHFEGVVVRRFSSIRRLQIGHPTTELDAIMMIVSLNHPSSSALSANASMANDGDY